jgi:hypothetical protein
MHVGDIRLWRSQIVCWSLSMLFLILAVDLLYVHREPNKSFSVEETHAFQIVGVVFGLLAILFLIFAIRAKKKIAGDVV